MYPEYDKNYDATLQLWLLSICCNCLANVSLEHPRETLNSFTSCFCQGLVFFPLHFKGVWAVLTLCDCQIPSAVGWDNRKIYAGPCIVGRKLETACLYHT